MNTVSPPGSRRAPSVAPVTAAPRHVHPPIPGAPRAAVTRPFPIPEYFTWGGEPVQVLHANTGRDLIQELINPQVNNLENLLHQALHAVFPPIPQNLESVVVAPTAGQIAAATVIQTVTAENEMCPICQDSVVVGANVRHLTACGHRFHTGCIDTWFTRNVHCPVCRHDIREADPVAATATRQ